MSDEAASREECIIQKKDSGRQKASEECPWRNIQDKRIRPGRPCDDSFCPEQYCVRSMIQVGFLPRGGTEWKQGRERALLRDPARVFSSGAAMESIERNRELWKGFFPSTGTTSSIPQQRSQFSARLRLLWLNFLLIPIRIRYMLRHISRGPYGKPIIINRGKDQLEN